MPYVPCIAETQTLVLTANVAKGSAECDESGTSPLALAVQPTSDLRCLVQREPRLVAHGGQDLARSAIPTDEM